MSRREEAIEITTAEALDSLPSGTHYVDADGNHCQSCGPGYDDVNGSLGMYVAPTDTPLPVRVLRWEAPNA